MRNSILTVGHSNHSLEALLELLRIHGVTAIADVRSQPYGRVHPQFARERLRDGLRAAGISYVFLGKELGGRSADPAAYVDGRIRYERVAQAPWFKAGLTRLIEGASSYRVAMLCAEKDPLVCHRTLLVARELSRQGLAIDHILHDGALESHQAAEIRLLRELGLPNEDMFRTRAEILDEAYERRSAEVGYRLMD